MDKKAFNEYLDNLLVQAKVEHEMSDFTRAVNQIISDTEFDESKQAFLFVSIDNIDQQSADSFVSYVGNPDGLILLLEAVKIAVNNIKKTACENNDDSDDD